MRMHLVKAEAVLLGSKTAYNTENKNLRLTLPNPFLIQLERDFHAHLYIDRLTVLH